MNRLTVIQTIIDRGGARTYLEIGVRHGGILARLKCRTKIGIDPYLKLSGGKQFKNFVGIINFKTYRMTSDEFFLKEALEVLGKGIDVAFVDGLHTYGQSLKDVENCLKYLNEDGVIVMHDCSPLNHASAYPVKESVKEVLELAGKGELPGWNDTWNGDVWKTLVHTRIVHDDLEVFTLDLDFGLGIISRGKGNGLKSCTVQDIKQADYSFLERDRVNLLNLKPPKYLYEFLDRKYDHKYMR
jgi:hypothetical protein